jgi:hypothetical protein
VPSRPATHFWTALAITGGAWLAVQPAAADGAPFTWGQVLDADTGHALAHATRTDPSTGATGQTDEDGAFCLDGPVTALHVICDGYQPQTFRITRPSLVARRHGDGAAGGRRLADTGFALRLQRLPPPEPEVTLLPAHVTLGWRPDSFSEGLTGPGVAPSPSGSLRSAAAWLDASLRLGPALLSGTYGSHWYHGPPLATGERASRLQHQGAVALGYAHHWSRQLATTIGPAITLQQNSVLAPPPGQSSQEPLAVASTRWGAGLLAGVAAWPWPVLPVTLEARLGLFPATWQLTDGLHPAPQGMWAMQGSLGLRWYPLPRLGLDLRYLYDHWQTTAYYQGSHGGALGGMILF